MNPDSIKEERDRQRRDELMLQRFERVTAETINPFRLLFARAVTATKVAYHASYLKLVRLEKFYAHAKAPFAALNPSVRDRVKTLVDEARSLARDLKWAEAERRYLDVLAIDNRYWDAYRGLGGIYLKQKMYPQAKETFEFLLKMKKGDDATFAALADIAEQEGDMARAEEMRGRAVEIRPRLANRHAEMATFYVARSDAPSAWPFAKRAVELDAKSGKYLELLLEVAILLGDRMEARKAYDKLRLVSDDRPRLQSLKDKLDSIMPL